MPKADVCRISSLIFSVGVAMIEQGFHLNPHCLFGDGELTSDRSPEVNRGVPGEECCSANSSVTLASWMTDLSRSLPWHQKVALGKFNFQGSSVALQVPCRKLKVHLQQVNKHLGGSPFSEGLLFGNTLFHFPTASLLGRMCQNERE